MSDGYARTYAELVETTDGESRPGTLLREQGGALRLRTTAVGYARFAC